MYADMRYECFASGMVLVGRNLFGLLLWLFLCLALFPLVLWFLCMAYGMEFGVLRQTLLVVALSEIMLRYHLFFPS